MVREATPGDLNTLTPLFDAYRQFYGQRSEPERSRRFLQERLERSESVIFLSFEEATATGFTQLYPSFSSGVMARIYILNDLFVVPEARGRGAGTALLETAAEYGRRQGAVRLVLSTEITNTPAQSLYEKTGWKRDTAFLRVSALAVKSFWPESCSVPVMQRVLFFAIALILPLFFTGASAKAPSGRRAAHKSSVRVNPEAAEEASTTPITPGATGSKVMRAQILLDRARFSPGEIDARYGDDLGIAVRGYQHDHGLKVTGAIDAAMWDLLNRDTRPLLTTYTITEADVRGPFQPIPAEVQEQARMKSMGYESPQEGLAERFHISPRLLAELNPGKSLKTAGEELMAPDVRRAPARRAARVVVSAMNRTVFAYDFRRNVLAQYPATIGGEHDPLPLGHWVITVVEQNPWFFFDPAHLWNADPNEAKAKLPPGPNNPVGLVWMGLSKRHYGIHGTPDPGHIRHGESNGCIRLTNWDAEDLSHMVRRGTPAILEE